MAEISFCAGSGTPITPVEEGNTSSARQPKTCATEVHVARAASSPAWPAAQFAFPALIATTRTLPPDARRFSLSITNGAAVTRFEVNAAATLAGALETIKEKSGRPLVFTPAVVAPNRKPRGIRKREESLMATN